jgi:hypothetical protein
MAGGSLVDIVTWQQAGPSCFYYWMRQEIVIFSKTSTQPLVQQLHAVVNLGVKRPDRETDHSPLSSAPKTLPNVFKTWRSSTEKLQLHKFLLIIEWTLCH